MNREIKFRAYRPDSGMKYFRLNHIDNGCVLFDDGDWRPLSDCELMQFTGLLDKNSKEIYEGDIVKWSNGDIEPVIWDDNHVGYIPDLYGFETGEVIGNIYSNPELVKETP